MLSNVLCFPIFLHRAHFSPPYFRSYFDLLAVHSFISFVVHVVYCIRTALISFFAFSKSPSSFLFPFRYLGIDLDSKGKLAIYSSRYLFHPNSSPSLHPSTVSFHCSLFIYSSSITHYSSTAYAVLLLVVLVCCPSGFFPRLSNFSICTQAV